MTLEPAAAVSHVMVATDLSGSGATLFAHALRLLVDRQGQLDVVHIVDPDKPTTWKRLPTVRELLTSWGVLDEGASVDDYAALGLRVRLLDRIDGDSAHGVARAAQTLHPDLLVVGTHHRNTLERWTVGSVAEHVARRAGQAVLVVPDAARPLVDRSTGELTLRRVLVPYATEDDLAVALPRVLGLLRDVKAARAHVTLLHVGTPPSGFRVHLEDGPLCTFARATVDGGVVDGILDVAGRDDADLIVMATRGHDSLLDVLAGSTTERVMRRAAVPVLAVPVR